MSLSSEADETKNNLNNVVEAVGVIDFRLEPFW